MRPLTVSILDGLIFLATWTAIVLLVASSLEGGLRVLAFGILPVAFLVAWRGYRLAKKIAHGSVTFLHAARDGFLWGTLLGMAYVALHVLENISSLPSEITPIATYALVYIGLGSVVGATHGIAVYFLNVWLAANQSNKAPASQAGTH